MSESIKAYLKPDTPCLSFELELASKAAELYRDQSEKELAKKRKKLAKQLNSLKEKVFKRSKARARKVYEDKTKQKINELDKVKEEIKSKANSECLDAAFLIAKEIVGEELQANPSAYKSRVEACLAELCTDFDFTLTVHPDEQEQAREIINSKGLSYHCHTSEKLSKGDIEITLNTGTIKFSLQEHLKNFKQSVAKGLNGSGA